MANLPRAIVDALPTRFNTPTPDPPLPPQPDPQEYRWAKTTCSTLPPAPTDDQWLSEITRDAIDGSYTALVKNLFHNMSHHLVGALPEDNQSKDAVANFVDGLNHAKWARRCAREALSVSAPNNLPSSPKE